MTESSAALRVVRGDPSPEDLAALSALLTAAGGAAGEPAPPVRGRWNDPSRQHQRPLHPGPGAWRATS